MNKKLQWLGKVFFLSIAILLWAGCENDEIGSRPDSNSQITKRLITLGELRQKASDYEKLQTIEQKIESNRQSPDGRMEYDSLYGFYIDTEKILLIEKAGYYSYTIPIKRDAENGKVENLVLSFDADGTFKSYLTAYSLTAEEKNQLSDGEKVANLETKTSIAALSDNAASSGGSGAGIFHDANGNCFVINHIWTDQSGTLAWNYIQIDCPENSGGGSGEGSGDNAGSNPGGWPGNYPDPGGYENPGGGGTGENGGEVITEPILPVANTDNCRDLKTKSSNQEFKDKMNELKADSDGTTGEKGFVTFAGNPKFSEKYSAVPNDPSGIQMPAPSRTDCTGFMHCHMNDPALKNFAIFTPDDFIAQSELIANSTASLNSFTMYVTSKIQGTVNNYAIKITDMTKFKYWATAMRDYKNLYSRAWKNDINPNYTPEKQINNFLKLMKAENFEGFELFKADENLQNWKQLKLNSSNNTIEVKC